MHNQNKHADRCNWLLIHQTVTSCFKNVQLSVSQTKTHTVLSKEVKTYPVSSNCIRPYPTTVCTDCIEIRLCKRHNNINNKRQPHWQNLGQHQGQTWRLRYHHKVKKTILVLWSEDEKKFDRNKEKKKVCEAGLGDITEKCITIQMFHISKYLKLLISRHGRKKSIHLSFRIFVLPN